MMLNKNTLAFIATAALVHSSTVAAGGQLRGSSQNTRRTNDARCPVETQTTGMTCTEHVPAGMKGYICQYGKNLCECDTAKSNTWTCTDRYQEFLRVTDSNNSSIGGRTEPIEPKPAPVPQPQPVQQPVSQPVQQTVSAPNPIRGTGNVIVSTNEGTVAVFNNDPGCPATKPNDGESCSNKGKSRGWMRCKYPIGDGRGVNCDCNGDREFQCRPDNDLRAIFYNSN